MTAITDLSRSLVFFDNGGPVRRQAFEPIADEAAKRNFSVRFEDDLSADAEIGFYNEHTEHIKEINATLSCRMFHGIDDMLMNPWRKEKWGQYDIGFVPGNLAASLWQQHSWHPNTRPSIGVFPVGWPKSDYLYTDEYRKMICDKRSNYASETDTVLLYAPERLSKPQNIIEFIESADGICDVALIKRHPTDIDIPDDVQKHIDGHDFVHLLDADMNVLHSLSMSDVLVSGESSVHMEALLTDTISIAVKDWPTQHSSGTGQKTLPQFTITTTRDKLTQTLYTVERNYETELAGLKNYRDEYFSFVGESSTMTVNILEALLNGQSPSVAPVEANSSRLMDVRARTGDQIANVCWTTKRKLSNSLDDDTRERLKNTRLNKTINGLLHRIQNK